MKIVFTTVAIGQRYELGAARIRNHLARTNPQIELRVWNQPPPGTPTIKGQTFENGRMLEVDYTPYAAKPYALAEALRDPDCQVAVLLDACFVPIRDVTPLIDHIITEGYYLCRNGYNVGEWASDASLAEMQMEREDAFKLEDISSYCVGVCNSHTHSRQAQMVRAWCMRSTVGTIAGAHTADWMPTGRNRGFVSQDQRVQGHRHDQTVLSIVAHSLGMTQLVARPKFTAYHGYETEETVLVNKGINW